jgi:hypothetical protein
MSDSIVLVTPMLAGLVNLTLHVGEHKDGQPVKRFSVMSAILRLASPVWNAMLKPEGPFMEKDAKTVKFPDDDADAIEAVLQILHHWSNCIPETLEFPLLLNLALLINKYELQPSVSTYLRKWGRDLEASSKSRHIKSEKFLFCAWTFGLP